MTGITELNNGILPYTFTQTHITNTDITDITDIMSYLYANIVHNWNQVENNANAMLCLDMNNNILCKKFKLTKPQLEDIYIQASVLTIMITMIYSIYFTLQTRIFNSAIVIGSVILSNITSKSNSIYNKYYENGDIRLGVISDVYNNNIYDTPD